MPTNSSKSTSSTEKLTLNAYDLAVIQQHSFELGYDDDDPDKTQLAHVCHPYPGGALCQTKRLWFHFGPIPAVSIAAVTCELCVMMVKKLRAEEAQKAIQATLGSLLDLLPGLEQREFFNKFGDEPGTFAFCVLTPKCLLCKEPMNFFHLRQITGTQILEFGLPNGWVVLPEPQRKPFAFSVLCPHCAKDPGLRKPQESEPCADT